MIDPKINPINVYQINFELKENKHELKIIIVHLIRRHYLFPGVDFLLFQLIYSLKSHEILVTSMLSLLADFDMHYKPKNGIPQFN